MSLAEADVCARGRVVMGGHGGEASGEERTNGAGSLLTLEPKTAAGVVRSLILTSVSANYREIRE